jgi:hypothetical protein
LRELHERRRLVQERAKAQQAAILWTARKYAMMAGLLMAIMLLVVYLAGEREVAAKSLRSA